VAIQSPVQIRYNPSRAYANTQNNYVGAQSVAGRRGTLPTFNDANTKYVAKTGSDGAAGTAAAPYLTITFALSQLAGAFRYVVVQDSETYRERLEINYTVASSGGLYAADGQSPKIEYGRGAIISELGAREAGRTKFSAGAFPATFYFVSKAGNDGTGVRGDIGQPFLTIQGALDDGARLAADTVSMEDSGLYDDGAITVTANAVTIQAKDGEVPTLRTNAAGLFTIDVACSLYGLTMTGLRQVVGSGLVILQNTAAAFECYDCSLIDHPYGLVPQPSFDGTMDIYGCYFYRQHGGTLLATFDVTRAVDFENCLFDQVCSTRYGISPLAVLIIQGGAVNTADLTVKNSTFLDCDGEAHVYINYTANHADGDTIIESCVLKNERSNKAVTHGIYCLTADGGDTLSVANTLFEGLGGSAFYQADGGTLGVAKAMTMRGCVAKECGSENISTRWTVETTRGGKTFDSVALLGAGGGGGFKASLPAGLTEAVKHQNCVVINSAGTCFTDDLAANATMTGILELCSGAGATGTVGYDRILGAGAIARLATRFLVMKEGFSAGVVGGDTLLTDDPLYVNTTLQEENASLAATSPCVNRGGLNTVVNIGLDYELIEVTGAASAFTIDGFRLDGDKNFHSGVRIAIGLVSPVTVSFCTLTGFSVQAIFGASGAIIANCSFQASFGFGVNLPDAAGTVRRSVGYKCLSAFVLVAATSAVIENNSSYGCAYGQFDLSSVTARDYKNNIYSASGVFDYAGDTVQNYSSVGAISEDANVVNGTRLDPLFRDTGAGDLRLQTIEEGYHFNSPAKGTADDSDDMGAFGFTYGALAEAWTIINFSAGDYRNPDRYVRNRVTVKLAQGEKYNGDFYSDGQAFKTEHQFIWDARNDMPSAQVEDLIQLYITGGGECQLSFDGGSTWIPCRVVRKKPVSYTEIRGAFYSSDDLPTPIAKMNFRESA